MGGYAGEEHSDYCCLLMRTGEHLGEFLSESRIYFLAFIFFITSGSTLITVAEFLGPFLGIIIEQLKELLKDRLTLRAAGEKIDFCAIFVVSFN